MRIHLKFTDRDGERHEVQGIWPSTSSAILWALNTYSATRVSAQKVWSEQ